MDDENWLFPVFALQTGPVNQIKQEHGHQGKEDNGQERAEIPQIGNDNIPHIGDGRNDRENLLVGQAVNDRPDEKTQQSRDKIIELAFTAPGGAGPRSVTGERHPDAE